MSRELPEWVARHDDQAIPLRVQKRVHDRAGGICPKCTRPLVPGQWACDHIIALINGGQHRDSNLQPLCVSPCHSTKTKTDVAEKAMVYRKRAKHLGIKQSPRPMPGSRASGLRKRMNGQVERRT
jgi:5-methylcytosine-specific restriction protein A